MSFRNLFHRKKVKLYLKGQDLGSPIEIFNRMSIYLKFYKQQFYEIIRCFKSRQKRVNYHSPKLRSLIVSETLQITSTVPVIKIKNTLLNRRGPVLNKIGTGLKKLLNQGSQTLLNILNYSIRPQKVYSHILMTKTKTSVFWLSVLFHFLTWCSVVLPIWSRVSELSDTDTLIF